MRALLLPLLWLILSTVAFAQDDEATAKEVPAETATEVAEENGGEQAADEVEEAAPEDEAEPTRLVRIYYDGGVCTFEADEEWEFFEVECADIRQGNADLMREVSACGSEGALALGASIYNGNDDPQLGLLGRSLDGPVGQGEWKRRIGRNGDWQELFFDFADEDSYSAGYDRSTLRGNIGLDQFTRNGYVFALRSDDDSSPASHAYDAGTRDRSLTDATYRSGSAEGGNWRLSLRHYDLEIGDDVPAQPDDSRMTRVELSGRVVECDTTLEGAVFAGSYLSRRAVLDNDFSRARLDASHWLGERFELQADGSVTRIEAGLQDGGATRSDYSAQLGWDMSCDLRLSAFARGYSDASDISAASSLRVLRDSGARLDFRPDGNTSLSATLTDREVDSERVQLENNDILPFIVTFDPVPTREDLAGLRVNERARGRLLDIAARHRFDCRFHAGASYREQDYSTLPPTSQLFAADPFPAYFADHASQASLHAAYDLCNIGNVTFRADRDRRENSARGSSFARDQYTLGYSAPLYDTARLGLGVTRQETSIATTSAEDDFSGSGWNYSLNLSGASGCTSYVISASRATSAGHDGGDLSALGLELDFASPWRLSAWWRQWGDFLGGRSASDIGVQASYRIEL
jgi:hypothetical protein